MATTEDSSDYRQYSPKEWALRRENLAQVYELVELQESQNQHYSIELIRNWHYRIYHNVRPDFAGRIRTGDFGPDVLPLGKHVSTHKADVIPQLNKHIKQALSVDDQVCANQLQINEIVRAAVWIHCCLIPIQPFIDGNKTVARIAMSFWLCRWGLPPAIFEVPKEEYLTCVEAYLADKDVGPTYKLVMRLYDNQLDELN